MTGSTRGILRARAGLERFQIARRPPAQDLAPVVERHWILTWDLRDRPPHRQQVLSHPAVHMTFTTGGRARVVGVVPDVFSETIDGLGRVVGVRFRPGGFHPFLGAAVSSITNRYVPVEEIFGPPARALADAVIAEPGTEDAVAMVEDFLRARLPAERDPLIEEAAGAVARIAADPAVVRVERLAADLGIGVRRLQRLFAEYVGIGPKWVIRRYRMQEAAERAASGADVDWACLAADLGYADQPHFTREFTRTVGTPPARYAEECR